MIDQDKGLALLREPFDDKKISKLPKPMIGNEDWKKIAKGVCKDCGGYHAVSHTMHLDYVGHAAVTDRLLAADPNWSWEPLAFASDGTPLIDKDGGMWIKLTVCGVTRLGYGDAQGKSGANATKERIGDALRNAAMRFGVALDLWSKADLHADDESEDDKILSDEDKVSQWSSLIKEAQTAPALESVKKEILKICTDSKRSDLWKIIKSKIVDRLEELKVAA